MSITKYVCCCDYPGCASTAEFAERESPRDQNWKLSDSASKSTKCLCPVHRFVSWLELGRKIEESMQPDATWSATPPTAPGWYWWRKGDGEVRMVVEVVEAEDGSGRLIYGGRGEFLTDNGPGEWWTHPVREPQ